MPRHPQAIARARRIMRAGTLGLLLAASLTVASRPARADVLCTVILDAASGAAIRQEGDCARRVTPASTFKIAISLMGFDAGFLKDEHTPALPFREGYPDWLPVWRQTTDPAGWMKNSVVWYSQQVTQALGMERFANYAKAFDYGNADVAGDPGKNNGLTRAWLSSSLAISPLEQAAFLRKIVRRELPVTPHAYEMTARIMDAGEQPGGWHVYGKTGAGGAKAADGSVDMSKPFGWYVGWATKGERTVVFARLVQDMEKQEMSPGLRTREVILKELFGTPGAL